LSRSLLRRLRERLVLRSVRRDGARRQRGSILVMTLLGIGVLLGAFLYVAVIGSRAAEKVRVQTAADATALGAATIKARTLNYAAFLFMSESVLLPLGQVSWYITSAQINPQSPMPLPAVCALLFVIGFEGDAANCIGHIVGTIVTSKLKARDVGEWLSVLEETAGSLDEIGPVWAELVAAQTGTAAAYKSGAAPVDVAASFPIPSSGSCSGLGFEMVDNMDPIEPEGQSACKVDIKWEMVYAAMAVDLILTPLDVVAWMATDPDAACAWLPAPLSAMCPVLSQFKGLLHFTDALAIASGEPIPMEFVAKKKAYEALISTHILVSNGIEDTFNFLMSGSIPCHFENQVPALASSWKQHQRSVGLAMISKPSEKRMLARLGALRGGSRGGAPSGDAGGLLGIACAEHYSQGHIGEESLWHMDWRARLVPCQLKDGGGDRQLVERCGGSGNPLAERFTWQLGLGVGQDLSH
jgi:hypothetical protein